MWKSIEDLFEQVDCQIQLRFVWFAATLATHQVRHKINDVVRLTELLQIYMLERLDQIERSLGLFKGAADLI